MRLKVIVTTLVAVCAAFVLSALPTLGAQAPAKPQPAAAEKTQPADMAKCQAMMAEHEKKAGEMKAADLRLDELVTKMNAASATDKPAATAAVVTEMVAQRRAMRDGMSHRQHQMMGHMAGHMAAGGKDWMAHCPMMKPPADAKH